MMTEDELKKERQALSDRVENLKAALHQSIGALAAINAALSPAGAVKNDETGSAKGPAAAS